MSLLCPLTYLVSGENREGEREEGGVGDGGRVAHNKANLCLPITVQPRARIIQISTCSPPVQRRGPGFPAVQQRQERWRQILPASLPLPPLPPSSPSAAPLSTRTLSGTSPFSPLNDIMVFCKAFPGLEPNFNICCVPFFARRVLCVILLSCLLYLQNVLFFFLYNNCLRLIN